MVDWPDLRGRDLAIDTETYDPFLKTRGPGFLRRHNDPEKDSRLLGVSLSDGEISFYVPLEAADQPVDRDRNLRYLKEQISYSKGRRYFANALYDLESLDSEGIRVDGQMEDIFTNHNLLNENDLRPNLLSLAGIYCPQQLGMLSLTQLEEMKAQRSDLYQMPLDQVSHYACIDASLTFHVAKQQYVELLEQELTPSWQLETAILPILWRMYRKGVRVDLEYLESYGKQLKTLEDAYRWQLEDYAWPDFNPWAPSDMEILFNDRELPISYTPKGNPSFKNDILQNIADPAVKAIMNLRGIEKLRRDFINRYAKDAINGRLHARFNSARTVTGRMSSSRPNLQQVPKRTEKGAGIRKAFLPDEGCLWESLDYSSQEPRLAVVLGHQQQCLEADRLYQQYLEDPELDFHARVAEKSGTSRTNAKSIGLGKIYGRGQSGIVRQLRGEGVDTADAEDAYYSVSKTLSWVRKLDEEARISLKHKECVRTLLGRKRRIGDPRFYYRGVNARVQGSAAEQLKLAMVRIFQETGEAPLLPVHDELNYNIRTNGDAKPDSAIHERRKQIMESVMKDILEIDMPFPVDSKIGKTW